MRIKKEVEEIRGIIIPHRGRGRRLGIPTINLPAPADVGDGIYAGYVLQEQNRYPAAIFVGAAITFAEDIRQIEAHLIDVTTSLSGQVTIELVERIRTNQKFSSPELLLQQIQQDIISIKQCLPELSKNK